MRYPRSHIRGHKKWNGGCQGLGKPGNRELPVNGCRVSVWEDEVLEMDGGDGHTTMSMYLTPQNPTPENGKFYLTYILQKKKNPKKTYFHPKFFPYTHGSANSQSFSYNCTLRDDRCIQGSLLHFCLWQLILESTHMTIHSTRLR